MTTLRPFYFTVVFWGDEHRAYFTDLLLASLLSPQNIPSLKKERRSKFLIVTTIDDWTRLQSHSLFQQLQEYMETIFFEMPFPTEQDSKMLVMSQGHKQVSMKAYQDQAYGVFVTPDLVLSDGSVEAMERLAEEGKKVVLCIAIRFRQETILQAMQDEGFLKDGEPLNISSRQLMRFALNHLHSETLRYEFDAPYLADSPISVYWWAVHGEAMRIHSFSWAPLVVDYGALEQHDTKTFEKWTLDGDYIYRNFPKANDVHVITDSDEISLVSFTKESELHFDLIPEDRKSNYGILSEVFKVSLIRALKDSEVMDPLKREIFSKPVFLHSTDVKEEWCNQWQEANALIVQACRPPNLEEQFMMDVIAQSNSSKFSRMVLAEVKGRPTQDVVQHAMKKYFWQWLCLVRPRRMLLRLSERIGEFFKPVTNQFSGMIWVWRYRRFVWWRAKEKLGIVEERGFKWDEGGWNAPGVSLMCPLFTLKWLWQYRRYVWWRAKEKLGLVEERGFKWHEGGWNAPGVSVVCPLFTLKWAWKNRQAFYKDKHNLIARFRNRYSRDHESNQYAAELDEEDNHLQIETQQKSSVRPYPRPTITPQVVQVSHDVPVSKDHNP